MLESYLGPETFRAGVNLYLKEHAYGNATASDFWNAMARASKKPIDQIMPTFVMQAGRALRAGRRQVRGRQHDSGLCRRSATSTLRKPSTLPTTSSGRFLSASKASAIRRRSEPVLPDDQARAAVHHEGLLEVRLPQRRSAWATTASSYDANALQQLGNAAEQGLTPDERIALIGDDWALMRAGKHQAGDYLASARSSRTLPATCCWRISPATWTSSSRTWCTDADRPRVAVLAAADVLAHDAAAGLRRPAQRQPLSNGRNAPSCSTCWATSATIPRSSSRPRSWCSST